MKKTYPDGKRTFILFIIQYLAHDMLQKYFRMLPISDALECDVRKRIDS